MHADLFGPLIASGRQKKYILCMTDAFTKYAELVALENKEAPTVAEAIFTNWICRFGVPLDIVTDRGTEFCAKLSEELFKKLGATHLKTAPYHPQTNSQAEVANKTIQKYLSHFVDQTTLDWEMYLQPLMFSYNTSFHRTVLNTPHMLTFGQQARQPAFFPSDLNRKFYGDSTTDEKFIRLQHARDIAVQNAEQASDVAKAHYDQTAQPHNYQVKQWVLLREHQALGKNAKLAPRYTGPYRILKLKGPHNLEIKMNDRRSTRIVNVAMCKPYYEQTRPRGEHQEAQIQEQIRSQPHQDLSPEQQPEQRPDGQIMPPPPPPSIRRSTRLSEKYNNAKTVTLTPGTSNAPPATPKSPASPLSPAPATPKYTHGLQQFFPTSSPLSQGGEGSSSSRARQDSESTWSASEGEIPDEMLEALDLIKADEDAGWQRVLPKRNRRHKLIKKRFLAANAIKNLSELIKKINYYRKHNEQEPKWSTQKWVNFILTGDPEWTTPTEPYVEVDCSPPLILPNFDVAPAIELLPPEIVPAPVPEIAPAPAPAPAPAIAPAPAHAPAPAPVQVPPAEVPPPKPWGTATVDRYPGIKAGPGLSAGRQRSEPTPGPSRPPTSSTTSPTVGSAPLPLTAAQRAAGVTRVQDGDRVLTTVPEALLKPTLSDRMEHIRTSHPVQYATRRRLEREGIILPDDILSRYPPTKQRKHH